ncbi:hypothetical protein ACXZ66_06800 [Corynebacterium sp. S7]
MRTSLVAVAAAVSLAFAGAPAASAKESSTTEISSQVETSSAETSSAETSSSQKLEDHWNWATEGLDMMSSGSSGSTVEGSSRVALDWVLGSVAATAFGSLYVAVMNALKSFF